VQPSTLSFNPKQDKTNCEVKKMTSRRLKREHQPTVLNITILNLEKTGRPSTFAVSPKKDSLFFLLGWR
jgi:hypothetical protein